MYNFLPLVTGHGELYYSPTPYQNNPVILQTNRGLWKYVVILLHFMNLELKILFYRHHTEKLVASENI